MYSTYNNYLGGIRVPESSMRSVENYTVVPQPSKPIQTPNLEAKGTADPKVWGPAMWFFLHVSAAHYPENASPLVMERMKGRILSIPYEIPCSSCRAHAVAFIEKNSSDLDKIVAGRHSLGQFYTDFHNAVNRRYGKAEWSYDKVYNHYSK